MAYTKGDKVKVSISGSTYAGTVVDGASYPDQTRVVVNNQTKWFPNTDLTVDPTPVTVKPTVTAKPMSIPPKSAMTPAEQALMAYVMEQVAAIYTQIKAGMVTTETEINALKWPITA